MIGYSYYRTDGWSSDASVWQDNEGDTMKVRTKASGEVYGISQSFDCNFDSMAEASKQLQEWGYRFIGTETS